MKQTKMNEEMKDIKMKDIKRCVVCGKNLSPRRSHVDVCGERCFRALLKKQREQREGN